MTGPVLLFLDVDGTLLPFGGPPPTGPTPRPGEPILNGLTPAHGPRLTGLGCTLIWATAWGDAANDAIAPILGLPRLPVVDWPDDAVPSGIHWKLLPLLARAGDHAFIWVDDEITEPDRDLVQRHHPAPALLHRVDHRASLTEADFGAIERWLHNL